MSDESSKPSSWKEYVLALVIPSAVFIPPALGALGFANHINPIDVERATHYVGYAMELGIVDMVTTLAGLAIVHSLNRSSTDS